MAEQTEEIGQAETPKKRRIVPLLLGLLLLGGSAAGGYFAAAKGYIPIPEKPVVSSAPKQPGTADDVAFVPLQPLVITLGRDAKNSHLRFNAQLEVFSEYEKEVARMQPRFLDVLNSYLQALEASDIEDPDAYLRMRAQALRRMQVVAGPGRVRDLLITEFVLN